MTTSTPANHLTAGDRDAAWREPLNLDIRHNSNHPVRWDLWDLTGLPPAIGLEVGWCTPELPQAADQAGEFDTLLYPKLFEQGARTAVADFLATATDRDELLDRRAFVVLCGHLLLGHNAPKLPLLAGVADDLARPRLLRPLELALLRTAAYHDTDIMLMRLLTAGANERETAAIPTDSVHIDEAGQVTVAMPGLELRCYPRTLCLAPDISIETQRAIAASGELLFACGRDQTIDGRHHFIHRRLRRLLETAGFGNDRSVTVESIINTGMRAAARQFGLEAAATALGKRNLVRVRDRLQLSAPD